MLANGHNGQAEGYRMFLKGLGAHWRLLREALQRARAASQRLPDVLERAWSALNSLPNALQRARAACRLRSNRGREDSIPLGIAAGRRDRDPNHREIAAGPSA